jgi:pre-mRNA-processing factor 40
MHEKVSRRNEDDKHQAERQQRRAIDSLRSYIKHLEPPIRIDETFEKVKPRIENSEEYIAVSLEESRRVAFDKVIKRLKEKEDDAEKDRIRRRERVSVDRPTHRDRDRGERPHRTSGRHTRSSRSPEPDAYEADRRKAIADREKNYHRKGSVADTLLSPSRRDGRGDRERDRDDRDLDRPHRSRREEAVSHYDRDRRDRENDREKLFRRRGDPRGSIDELPYGDERPSGGSRRRRADSDVESAGSTRGAKVSRSAIDSEFKLY